MVNSASITSTLNRNPNKSSFKPSGLHASRKLFIINNGRKKIYFKVTPFSPFLIAFLPLELSSLLI